jgi:hypothetical protein
MDCSEAASPFRNFVDFISMASRLSDQTDVSFVNLKIFRDFGFNHAGDLSTGP